MLIRVRSAIVPDVGGALTGGLAGAIGATAAQAIGSALQGGILSVAQGGKFVDGAKGGLIGFGIAKGISWANNKMASWAKGKQGGAEAFSPKGPPGSDSDTSAVERGGYDSSGFEEYEDIIKIHGAEGDVLDEMQSDVVDIFGTKRGKEMVDHLRENGKSVDIYINDKGINTGWNGKVNIDPLSVIKIQTITGPIFASARRILAHELGHAVFNIRDSGPNSMRNIYENENPIMQELGQPRRTHYCFDKSKCPSH